MTYKEIVLEFKDIDVESFKNDEPTLYKIKWKNVEYDFLIRYVEESRNTIIFGTGAIGSVKPIFSRATWMNEIKHSAIWYFDATLYMYNNINLAWGYGNNENWVLDDIALLLMIILQKQGVKFNNTLFFGSSGGGFMSIILATMFKSKALAINPQLIIDNYYERIVNNLKKAIGIEEDESFIECRSSIVKNMIKENYVPTIYIYQNIDARDDFVMQIAPFFNEIATSPLYWGENIHLTFYNVKGGA